MLILGPSSEWGTGDTTELEEKIVQLENRIATLAAARVVYVHAPVAPGSSVIELVRGDSYTSATGRAIDFISEDWPNLTDAAIVLSARGQARGDLHIDHLPGQIVKPTSDGDGPATVRFEMSSAQTAALPLGVQSLRYDVQATLPDGEKVTLLADYVTVRADVSDE